MVISGLKRRWPSSLAGKNYSPLAPEWPCVVVWVWWHAKSQNPQNIWCLISFLLSIPLGLALDNYLAISFHSQVQVNKWAHFPFVVFKWKSVTMQILWRIGKTSQKKTKRWRRLHMWSWLKLLKQSCTLNPGSILASRILKKVVQISISSKIGIATRAPNLGMPCRMDDASNALELLLRFYMTMKFIDLVMQLLQSISCIPVERTRKTKESDEAIV